jgi:hypothetical protein
MRVIGWSPDFRLVIRGDWPICEILIGPSCQRTLLELKPPATAKPPSTPREISTNRLDTKGRRSEATATYRYLSHLSNPFPLPTLILIIKQFSPHRPILSWERSFLHRHQLLLLSKTTLFVKPFFSTPKFCPFSPSSPYPFLAHSLRKSREKREQIISYSIPPLFLLDRLFQNQSGYTNIICSNKLSSFFLRHLSY